MKRSEFEISEEAAQKIKERWAEDTLEQWAKEKSRASERWAFKEMRGPSLSELGPIFFVAVVLIFAWTFVSDIFPADYVYGHISYFFAVLHDSLGFRQFLVDFGFFLFGGKKLCFSISFDFLVCPDFDFCFLN